MPGATTTFGTYSLGHAATAYDGRFDGKSETNHNTHNVTTNNYIATWHAQSGETLFKYLDVNVQKQNTRAFMVDEGSFPGGDNFIYKGGIIRLQNSENVGIDVQGTHQGSLGNIYQMSVYNRGTIIGEGNNNTKQAGISFNNFDASNDTTRVFLSNEGPIKMNAPISAGMMLRPEINSTSGGLNMQFAQNTSAITLNGRNNVGVTVVKNPKNTGFDKTNYKVMVPVGGLLASRSDEANRSGILNTGTIDILGDDSAGVSILNTIQEVKVNGNINIGVGDPTTLTGDGASSTLANRISGGIAGKVEGSVGVYTEEMTRPVRAKVYKYTADGKQEFEADGVTPKVVEAYYDDHGRVNDTHTTTTYTETDAHGNIVNKLKYTGVTIGTETVEVSKTVTLGPNSASSFGLRNKASGSIT